MMLLFQRRFNDDLTASHDGFCWAITLLLLTSWHKSGWHYHRRLYYLFDYRVDFEGSSLDLDDGTTWFVYIQRVADGNGSLACM